MKKWTLLIVFLVVSSTAGMCAQAASSKGVLENFKKNTSTYSTLKADFHYSEIPVGSKGHEIFQQGTFMQKGPGLMKVDFQQPHIQTILVRGNISTSASPDNPERSQDRIPDPTQFYLSRSVPSLLQPLALLPYLGIRVEGKIGKEWLVVGTPTGALSSIGAVHYYLSEDSFLPIRRAVFNTRGRLQQLTEYQYEKIGKENIPTTISGIFPDPTGTKMISLRLENIQLDRPILESEFVIGY